MKIFKAEAKDGLTNKIRNNTIAFCTEAIPYTPTDIELNKVKAIKAIAENKDHQLDLYHIKSILASIGWNKNDDVFDPSETWRAKSSPEDKQFNFMHDEKDIIGHITNCYAADAAGNILPDFNDMSQVPSAFDIVTGAVLYTSWSDPKLKNRMEKIIADIESGKTWHVSMECLFPAFDYAMIDSKGNQKVVKREESSAFLTKHLRAYGGNGEYEGYKVGRLLRNFSFSGVGLVKKPANPRSVILNHQLSTNFSESKAEEINMNELELLKAELAEAKKAEEDAKKAKEEAEKSAKEKSEAEASSFASLQSQLAEAQEALAVEKKDKEKMAEELNKMKKEKMMSKRKAELVEAGLDSAEVEETSAQFASLADEVFQTVVAAIKKVKTNNIEKKIEAPQTPVDVYVHKTVKASEEVDANEVDADVLDSAVATSNQIPMVDSAEEENVRSFASEWFSSKVLKSTANIK